MEIYRHPLYQNYELHLNPHPLIFDNVNNKYLTKHKRSTDGYWLTTIKKEKSSRVYVHRFTAECFTGKEIEKDKEVHHKNGNLDDNTPENLEIISIPEHHKITRKNTKKGTYNVIQDDTVIYMCKSLAEAHKQTGVSP